MYKVSSVWDKQKKSSRKITGEMIGRITKNEGLIAKGTKKTTKKQVVLDNFSNSNFSINQKKHIIWQ